MSKIILFFVVFNLFTGCQGKEQPQNGSATTTSINTDEQGSKLFMHHCAPCHGKLAKGGLAGPDLTVNRFKYGKKPADIEKSIAVGRVGGMPAFGSQLKQEEIRALTDYLLSLK